MTLPIVLSEVQTLATCSQFSVARFGDGELRLAIGGGCSSQRADPALARELRIILARYHTGLVVCIPNFAHGPRVKSWTQYASGAFAELYKQPLYGSAFITRPDNAPKIDHPEYWAHVRSLWADKDITLVCGDDKSLTAEMMSEARSVRVVSGPRQHAYEQIDALEAQIGTPTGTVILCLGATATCLAARLHAKKVHALDLGHIGMFMRHAGAYRFSAEDLASLAYRAQLTQKHRAMRWGKSGASHAPEILTFANELGATSVLDYGAGCATLAASVPTLKVFAYDPGTAAHDLPKPADLVVSTDVLEHVEADKIDNVLQHQYLLARKGAYFVIALTAARELLPDGRNAHLLIQPVDWWLANLRDAGWRIQRHEQRKGLNVWAHK